MRRMNSMLLVVVALCAPMGAGCEGEVGDRGGFGVVRDPERDAGRVWTDAGGMEWVDAGGGGGPWDAGGDPGVDAGEPVVGVDSGPPALPDAGPPPEPDAGGLDPRLCEDATIAAQGTIGRLCAGCHGPAGAGPGGLRDILDVPALISSGRIVPGDPMASGVYRRMASGSMPPAGRPRPTTEDIAQVAEWIRCGAPEF